MGTISNYDNGQHLLTASGSARMPKAMRKSDIPLWLIPLNDYMYSCLLRPRVISSPYYIRVLPTSLFLVITMATSAGAPPHHRKHELTNPPDSHFSAQVSSGCGVRSLGHRKVDSPETLIRRNARSLRFLYLASVQPRIPSFLRDRISIQ